MCVLNPLVLSVREICLEVPGEECQIGKSGYLRPKILTKDLYIQVHMLQNQTKVCVTSTKEYNYSALSVDFGLFLVTLI